MRRLVAGLAVTLDGVVEAPSVNGWLRFGPEMAAALEASLPRFDAVLLGRRGYLEFAQLWPKQGRANSMARFMNDTQKYVVTQTLHELEWSNSRVLGGEFAESVAALKALTGKDIQVPGSPTVVRSLIEAGLLDELALMIHPVVLGSGARLFDDMAGSCSLDLLSSQTFDSGVIYASYLVSQ